MSFRKEAGTIGHYFSQDNDQLESRRRTIRFHVLDRDYELVTDNGVFSKSALDFGTRVLLENLGRVSGPDVLDLGCGYGPIGIVAARNFGWRVVMADVNPRAVELAKDNAAAYHLDSTVVQSDGFSHLTGSFDAILMNPPIRTGKKIVYGLFAAAKDHLKAGGRLMLVIQKKQGADSALVFLRTLFAKVDLVAKDAGYRVFVCENI